MNEHSSLLTKLSDGRDYASLFASEFETKSLTMLSSHAMPTVLVEMINGYCRMTISSDDDKVVIADRLSRLI
jgi:hypothetical protein